MKGFLNNSIRVIHIGGHYGEKKNIYKNHNIPVLWIEAFQKNFLQLMQEIKPYANQRCIRALVLDSDKKKYDFYISNNEAASSSIFPLDQHKIIWPEVDFVEQTELESITLETLIKTEGIDLSLYDSLVLDTQGSELLILKGAKNILFHFKYIKTEAANFSSYQGGCVLHEIENYLQSQRYELIAMDEFATAKQVGSYYDILFRRKE